MPGWLERIAGVFTGKPSQRSSTGRSKSKTTPGARKSKTYVEGAGSRAALIEEARSLYRRRRAEAFGALNQTLTEFRQNPPKAGSAPEDLARSLALHKAHVRLNAMMSHDLYKYLVLTGIRGLLEDLPPEGGDDPPPSAKDRAKSARRIVSKR